MSRNATKPSKTALAAPARRKPVAAEKPAAEVKQAVQKNGRASSVAGTKVKPNRRSEETIGNILAATEEVVLRSGADRISILDVCQVAGVSRGTFYRYFSSQEDLLDTFSRLCREKVSRRSSWDEK